MDRNFGGVIWTNHALERLKQRNISQGDAWATWKRPDSSKFDSTKGVWVYKRRYGGMAIEIVAKKNEKGQWLILSVWSKKFFGESDKNKLNLTQMIKKLIFGN